jgi:Dihydrouridine synthase (Dus)
MTSVKTDNSFHKVILKMHKLFTTNPDLLQFCQQTGIFDQINTWLESGVGENYNKAIELINATQPVHPVSFAATPQEGNLLTSALTPSYKINSTVIIGNGDVVDCEEGLEKASESGMDGIMIGRGIFKNPWAFLPREKQLELDTRENRIKLLLEHLQAWQETWGDIKTLKNLPEFKRNSPENINIKNFASMKKFVKMYISGFAGALDLRVRFMDLNTSGEMINLCKKELDKNGFKPNNTNTHS